MKKIKLLLLEDMEMDAAIILRVLSRSGMDFEPTHVTNKDAFLSAVLAEPFDIILSDNYLPQFDAIGALDILKENKITTPLILVSGTASEEYAVNMMKAGVCDYILKDRLQRLPSAILSAIEKHTLAVTHKKHIDDIAKNEALMKEAERLAHLGSWEYDLVNNTSAWSDERYRILGYEPGEVTANLENFLARIHPDDRDYVKKRIDEAITYGTDSSYHYRVIKKDGRLSYLESQIFVTHDAHNKTIRLNGFSVDVTERKLAEESRLRSEANLRTIFDNTETGFALLDTELCVVSYNQPMYAFSLEQLARPIEIGKYAVDFFKPDRQAFLSAILQDAQRGVTNRYEVPYPQADGSDKWFDVNCHPVTDDNGKVIGIVMSETDITARKILELQQKQITDDLMQRNNVLEQFAYIISHNLRGPMTTILGISDLMKNKDICETERDFFLDGIEQSVKKLDNVVVDLNSVLQFKNSESEHKQKISFSDLLRDVSSGIHPPADNTPLTISTDFSAVDGMVTLKSYIHSIFYNLVSNSIKYKRPGVPLVLDVSSKLVKDKTVLIFRDNGLGMDLSKVGDQVFNLFKRFHPDAAEGKGMGLFMVKTQVETIGGTISVRSKVGEGTEFRMEF